MTTLTLEQASAIVEGALAKGRETECKPLTVAVLDAGGHLKALKREDGSSILRPQIAMGKAWGALGMGMSSRALGALAEARPSFVVGLMAASEGRMVTSAGGVLVCAADGEVLGAVGITGDTSDKDEVCALAGIAAAGLRTGDG
jgi:uncharacterized protein GlcG (DUF336 family)